MRSRASSRRGGPSADGSVGTTKGVPTRRSAISARASIGSAKFNAWLDGGGALQPFPGLSQLRPQARDEPRANREEQIFSPVLSDAPLLAERGGAERHVAAAPRAAMQVEGGDNTSPGRVARDCGIPFPLRSTESSTATAVDASRRKAR